jgi:hypothetical protein
MVFKCIELDKIIKVETVDREDQRSESWGSQQSRVGQKQKREIL